MAPAGTVIEPLSVSSGGTVLGGAEVYSASMSGSASGLQRVDSGDLGFVIGGGGVAIGTVTLPGGVESVGAQASASNITVGGKEFPCGFGIPPGGVESGVTVVSGDFLSAGYITIEGLSVQSGGNAIIGGAATLSGGTVSSGGIVQVSGIGQVSAVTVSNGGALELTSVNVNPGQTRYAGAPPSKATIQGVTFEAGVIIGAGSLRIIESGGRALGTILRPGGVEIIDSYGSANTTVSSGAVEIVLPYADASIAVLSGGSVAFDQRFLAGETLSAHWVAAATALSGVSIQAGAFEDVAASEVVSGAPSSATRGRKPPTCRSTRVRWWKGQERSWRPTTSRAWCRGSPSARPLWRATSISRAAPRLGSRWPTAPWWCRVVSGGSAVGEGVNGQARYTAVTALGPERNFVGTGDFVGDGKADLLIENTSGALFAGTVSSGGVQYAKVGGSVRIGNSTDDGPVGGGISKRAEREGDD